VVAQGYSSIALINVFPLDILSDGTWHTTDFFPKIFTGGSKNNYLFFDHTDGDQKNRLKYPFFYKKLLKYQFFSNG
jgi:hypothetical protein